jgi:hypothetical protein
MGHLNVGTRLGLAFGLLLALMLLAVGVAFVGLRTGAEHAGRLQRESVALLNAAGAMRTAQLEEAVAIRDFVSLPNVDAQRASRAALTASQKNYASAAKALDALAGDAAAESMKQLALRLSAASAKVTAKLGRTTRNSSRRRPSCTGRRARCRQASRPSSIPWSRRPTPWPLRARRKRKPRRGAPSCSSPPPC